MFAFTNLLARNTDRFFAVATHQHSTHHEIHAHASELMGKCGQRYTQSRKEIVSAIAKYAQPVGIADLLNVLKELPQSSLYRNLTVLQEAGVVTRVMSSQDGGLYELAERLTGHHHHLVCSVCGDVRDVVVPDALEHDLDAALLRLAKREGFSLDHHRLDLIGRCVKCS